MQQQQSTGSRASYDRLTRQATDALIAASPAGTSLDIDDLVDMVTVTFAGAPSEDAVEAAHELAGSMGYGIRLLQVRALA